MNIKTICTWFENGNVMVTGEKGSGKDVLFGNVIARINRPYISNVNYTKDDNYIPLELNKLSVGYNSYRDFISGKLKKYVYPYPDGYHIYISDAGNYFPAQYTGQLDRDYPYFPVLASLIRQLGECQIHTNCQAYERVWNKLREQSSDKFIRCDKCYVLFGKLVIGSFYFYDKASSCQDRVKPCRINMPLFCSREERHSIRMYLDKFYNTYGTVKHHYYICINKSKHDSRAFKKMLEQGGVASEK